MDAWTSPNKKAYVAITVHLAPTNPKMPSSFVLDFVDVPSSHTGEKLAEVFSSVVNEFGIANKVRYQIQYLV